MATPEDSSATDQGELQFEQAEFPAETGAVQEHVTRCSACSTAIPDVYYEANGKVVCSPCRDKIEAALNQGSRLGRVVKAFGFGTIAAAIGAILYYAIMRITGLNIGLVAVVVGLMVGGAVKAGSGRRGGRFYQLLAVFLTYSAIAAMYIPDMMHGIAKEFGKDAPDQVAGADGKAGPAQAPAPAPAAAPGDQARDEAAKKQPAPAAEPPVQPAPAQQQKVSIGGFLLAAVLVLGLLIGFAYSIPVLVAMQAPISGLIFGFAIWEAWKINRKVEVAFNGPFRLTTHPGDDPASEPEEVANES